VKDGRPRCVDCGHLKDIHDERRPVFAVGRPTGDFYEAGCRAQNQYIPGSICRCKGYRPA